MMIIVAALHGSSADPQMIPPIDRNGEQDGIITKPMAAKPAAVKKAVQV
jgi:hypothetical protein